MYACKQLENYFCALKPASNLKHMTFDAFDDLNLKWSKQASNRVDMCLGFFFMFINSLFCWPSVASTVKFFITGENKIKKFDTIFDLRNLLKAMRKFKILIMTGRPGWTQKEVRKKASQNLWAD